MFREPQFGRKPYACSHRRIAALLANQCSVLSLLKLLLRQNPDLDPALSSRRRSVELFLATLTHQVDQPWTLESMAENCGLGRTRFTHYCYELTNMSPAEFLNYCRIQRACQLLAGTPGQNITEIAFECGFSSSQYFATVFRQHLGVVPSHFRNSRRLDSPKESA